jgi:ABC-type bacteriocin/lantibiotic exporter with double-glycine peptidase domain
MHMRTLRFLLTQLDSFTTMFWLLVVVGLLDGAAGFAVPILLSEVTKNPAAGLPASGRILAILATCFSSTLVLQWCLRRWAESLSGWLSNELRATLLCRAEKLRAPVLSRYHSGYLASLINQVASTVGALSTSVIWLIGHLVMTLTLFFICTARESLVLACINSLFLTSFVAISVILSRRILPFADTMNTTLASVMERFFDLLTNIVTVKKLGIIAWAESSLRHQSRANNRAIAAFQRFHAHRWFLLHSIFFASFLTTIAFLLQRINANVTSPSILILFIAGLATVRGQAERLSELIKSFMEADAYVCRLEEILNLITPSGSQDVPPLESITIQDLSFVHPDSTHRIEVPEFTLRAGDRILVTGRSGQGKSTLLAILAKQQAPLQGQLLWNGMPYESYNDSLTHSFAIVSQEAELFDLSLRENLTLDRTIADSLIYSLLEKLDLTDLIRSLPEGLDSRVGERGLRLSAGQKQRINLARALLLERPILLLDEPTSHLDAATETCVLACLAAVDAATTLVIVSHHPSLHALCSRAYTFEKGVLRELAQ